MQDLDQRLTAQSNKIFQRFCQGLSGISPVGAAVAVGAAIAPFVVAGVWQEAAYSRELLATHGAQALADFQALKPNTAMAYMAQALTGSLPIPAQNMTALGIMAEATLPLIAGVGVYLAQSFTNLKQQITELKNENLLLSSGKAHQVNQNHDPNRPRGATRVAADAPASQRFESSMAALGQKLAATAEPEAAPRFRGPGL